MYIYIYIYICICSYGYVYVYLYACVWTGRCLVGWMVVWVLCHINLSRLYHAKYIFIHINVTGTSPSDCLVSYPGHPLWCLTPQ